MCYSHLNNGVCNGAISTNQQGFISISKVHWPMGKNSGNVNGVCRSLGAKAFLKCYGRLNKTSRNKSYFGDICLSWPVRQLRAALKPNLSLSQNTPVTKYTHQLIYILIYMWLICIKRSVN